MTYREHVSESKGYDPAEASSWLDSRLLSAVNYHDIKHWLDSGASVDARDYEGDSALAGIMSLRDDSLVKLFLDRGANVNNESHNGDTPLKWAVNHNYKNGARMVIQAGADPTKVFNNLDELFDFFDGDVYWISEDVIERLGTAEQIRRFKAESFGKKAFGI